MKKWGKQAGISITGGEPFLKPECFQLLKYLDGLSNVSVLNVITNGTVFNDEVSRIKEFITKFDTMLVSLDGVSLDVNETIRGKNTYHKVINNIKSMKQAGYRVVLMYTLLNSNLEDVKMLYDFCRVVGVDGFIIERFIPLGQSKKIVNSELVPETKIKEIYKHLYVQCNAEYTECDEIKYRSLKVLFTGYENPADSDEVELLSGALCVAGRDGFGLLPDGTVLPCRRFCVPVGNLLNEPLDVIWSKSELLQKVRETESCSGCYAMSLALTGNIE
jgi:MoaA/NifB/PqqE/SkfB family radical SAM enzyme